MGESGVSCTCEMQPNISVTTVSCNAYVTNCTTWWGKQIHYVEKGLSFIIYSRLGCRSLRRRWRQTPRLRSGLGYLQSGLGCAVVPVLQRVGGSNTRRLKSVRERRVNACMIETGEEGGVAGENV